MSNVGPEYNTVGGYKVAPGAGTPPPPDPSQTTSTDQVASGTGFVLDIPVESSVVVVPAVEAVRQVTLQNIGFHPLYLVGAGSNIVEGYLLQSGEVVQFLTRNTISCRIDLPQFTYDRIIDPAPLYRVRQASLSVARISVVL